MTRRSFWLSLLVLAAGPSYSNAHWESDREHVHGHTLGACDPGTYERPSVAAVINWANNVGIDNQHFTNDSGQAVRGLVAKHDIPPKTTLVSMHRSMALSMIIGQNSPFPDLIPNDVWRSCGENRQLGLILLKEAKEGSKSKFHLYIESLPREVQSLLNWSQTELRQLQMDSTPTEKDFLTQVKQQLEDTEQDYERLQNTPFVTSLGITLWDLKWAADMATSRSFAIPKGLAWFSPLNLGTIAVLSSLFFKAPVINRLQYAKQVAGSCRVAFMLCMGTAYLQSRASPEGDTEFALLPLMDLLNHNSSAGTTGDLQTSIFSSTLRLLSGPDPFMAGEEVTHSYGGKSNEALLQFYGFVDTDNPHDVYTADMADWVKTRYGVLQERWQFVRTDAAAMQSLQQAELRRDGWSNSAMASLRYLLAPQHEIDAHQSLDPLQWTQYLYKYRELPHIMTAWKEECSPETQHRVYQVLHDFCSEILASKPTALEADLQLLEALPSSAGNGDRQRLALQFRIGKKALLKSCIWQYDPAQLAA